MSFSWFALGFLELILNLEMLEIYLISKRAVQDMLRYIMLRKPPCKDHYLNMYTLDYILVARCA